MKKEEFKQDPLEAFISRHRDRFDDESPSPDVWDGIVDQTEIRSTPVRRIGVGWIRAVAAALLLLVGMGLGIFIMKNTMQVGQPFADQSGLGELEEYYYNEVNQLFVQLASNPNYEAIRDEMTRIDEEIDLLKTDLEAVPLQSKESVLQSIISAYENKIMMLETIMEHSKPYKERTYEEPVKM